tara:strand:+ start:193 stop:681 length:489 start_codon:yes stop_codon:yes gene_type:complete
MEKIAVTRFNEETWKEHCIWKNSRQYYGAIYNTPTKISPKILPNSILFIIEMNNSLNKIEGIGLIKNHLNLQKKIKIYKEENYNRFTYKSKYRIGKEDLSKEENKIIEVLEILLFKGSRHMKRGQGIQVIGDWIQYNKSFDFNKFIKNLFIEKYKTTENNIF